MRIFTYALIATVALLVTVPQIVLAGYPGITEVDISPVKFCPLTNHTTVSFTIADQGIVNATVLDRNGTPVRHLSQGRMENGSHAITWDGRDDGGNLTTDGNYTIQINATTFNYTFVRRLGRPVQPAGYFCKPEAIAINSTGYVYVADTGDCRIMVFTPDGTLIRMWGTRGEGEGQFYYPAGIAINSTGYVYVSDEYTHRLQIFDPNGRHIATIGGAQGAEPGKFSYPHGIAIDGSDRVYVADYYNDRIQEFDENGTLVRAWTTIGFNNAEPFELAINSSGYVYVNYEYCDSLLSFDSHGVPTGRQIGTNDLFRYYKFISPVFNSSDYLYVSDTDGHVNVYDKNDTRVNQFDGKGYIAINSTDYLYMWNTSSSTMEVRAPDGGLLKVWGSHLELPGELEQALDIAVNKTGYVYVSDDGKNRISVFDPAGNPIYDWSTWNASRWQKDSFHTVGKIALNESDYLYVIDRINWKEGRIILFTPDGKFVRMIGGGYIGNEYTDKASGIACNGDTLYITGYSNTIDLLNLNGIYVRTYTGMVKNKLEWPSFRNVMIAPDGTVYTINELRYNVTAFDSNGTCTQIWEPVVDWMIHDLAFYSGRIYIPDDNERVVYVCDYNGSTLAKFGGFGQLDWQLGSPESIAVSPDGIIYVADHYGVRVQAFRENISNIKYNATVTVDNDPAHPEVFEPERSMDKATVMAVTNQTVDANAQPASSVLLLTPGAILIAAIVFRAYRNLAPGKK